MTNVETLATELRKSLGRERSGEAVDFTKAMWQRLRGGAPVPRAAALRIAAETGLSSEEAANVLVQSAELDADGNVVGFSGLSLNSHPHQLDFGDQTLAAWCAWDPFFLVPALGGSARVTTQDPLSGVPIELRFEDGVVVESSVDAPVISVVVPEESDEGVACGESVETMLAAFCSQVHLFENEVNLRRYFSSRDSAVVTLSLEEAQALGGERVIEGADGEATCGCCAKRTDGA